MSRSSSRPVPDVGSGPRQETVVLDEHMPVLTAPARATKHAVEALSDTMRWELEHQVLLPASDGTVGQRRRAGEGVGRRGGWGPLALPAAERSI